MSTRLVSLIAAASLSAPAFAQTTWTSFEDRRGHAIASDTAGGVLMFGGEASSASGKLLKDTNSFATSGSGSSLTSTWLQLNPFGSPSARTEHAMASGVGSDDTAIFVLFGGLATQTSGPAIPNNETFVYEGGGWGKVTLTAAPSARTGHSMVTDTRRNRVVLFGGFSGGFSVNDLWEYDPTNEVWLQPAMTGNSPPSRFDHTTAYHPGNGPTDGRVYVFGGAPFRDDLWEFDPWTATWTDVSPVPASRPARRRRAAMSYLPAFDHVVMFGGQDNTLTTLGDTWLWDRFAGTWTQSTPANAPPARSDHAMAQDQLGTHVVLLGGEDGSNQTLAGTWLWNGVNWIEQLPPPSPREGVAMAYDRGSDRHPMFGGRTIPGGADLDETWELDGLNWREQTPSNAPSARSDVGLVYDPLRNRTVLYGGRTGGPCGTELGDTWEWDGQNWSPRALANNPPAAGGVQPVFDTVRNVTWMLVDGTMWQYDGTNWTTNPSFLAASTRHSFGHAYDSARGRWVVFGGNAGAGVINETWEWDGQRWYQMAPASSPTPRYECMMAYDPVRAVTVLCGGRINGTATTFNDTWEWDGTNWTQVSSSYLQRYGAGVAFNPVDSEVQFVCGRNGQNYQNAMWGFDGSSLITHPTGPSSRWLPKMAWDATNSALVLFGGINSNLSVHNDTWTYQAGSWTQQTSPATPAPSFAGPIGFDPASGNVLMHGGYAAYGGATTDTTWTWDGQAWTQRTPAHTPSSRGNHAIWNDGTRTFLWGGSDAGGLVDNDFWEWDGVDWRRLQPAQLTNYGAAYDARRDRVVVFGGRETCASGAYSNDTWEWDGTDWTRRTPTNSPSPRERSHLAFDEARGRVVLFGGTDGTNTFSDTWEWDGDNWIARLPTSSPPGSSGHGLTFDEQRKVTVAFGSAGSWDYGPEFPANIELYGSGCLGPNGVPALEPKPWAGPWLGGRLEVDLINAPSNGLGIFVWGFSETFWSGLPLPLDLGSFVGGAAGCQLFASADLTQIFLAGTNPYVSFVLPTQPVMNGVRMRAQAGFLPIGSPPVVSNALRMTFGSK